MFICPDFHYPNQATNPTLLKTSDRVRFYTNYHSILSLTNNNIF